MNALLDVGQWIFSQFSSSGLQGLLGHETLRLVADVVDVGLVAWLIYRLLLIIRGTRAVQMAAGLGAVFVVYQLARVLRLYALYSILDGLLTYIVLLVVVLFQNDLRRLLTRVGTRPLFRSSGHRREIEAVEEVVKAAVSLMQKRIGGIIVFERDALLDEFIQQGTTLDASVTRELLYSIFVPSHENPLHDGCVIIREGRIWQAGVFLPLSGSPKLDQSFGTRHRAAIGISEETDAVVVVVSEERGAISLCFHGNIVRDLDATSLRQALLGLFQGAPQRKRAGTEGRNSTPPRESRPRVSTMPTATLGDAPRDEAVPHVEGAVLAASSSSPDGLTAPGVDGTASADRPSVEEPPREGEP